MLLLATDIGNRERVSRRPPCSSPARKEPLVVRAVACWFTRPGFASTPSWSPVGSGTHNAAGPPTERGPAGRSSSALRPGWADGRLGSAAVKRRRAPYPSSGFAHPSSIGQELDCQTWDRAWRREPGGAATKAWAARSPTRPARIQVQRLGQGPDRPVHDRELRHALAHLGLVRDPRLLRPAAQGGPYTALRQSRLPAPSSGAWVIRSPGGTTRRRARGRARDSFQGCGARRPLAAEPMR